MGGGEDAIEAPSGDKVAIFRNTGDPHREALAPDELGLTMREMRRFDEAISLHQPP